MFVVRIYNNDDSVDIMVSLDDYYALKNFIDRQENMEIFLVK